MADFDAAFDAAWSAPAGAAPAFDAAFDKAWNLTAVQAEADADIADADAGNLLPGRGRAFANSLSMGLGEDVAGIAARYGDAWGKDDGVINTAKNIGKAALDGMPSPGEFGSDLAASMLTGGASTMVGPALRRVGILDRREGTPEEEQAKAERRDVLAVDEAADPVGTDVAAGLGIAAGLAPAVPGIARAVGAGVSRLPAAAGRAASGGVGLLRRATDATVRAGEAIPDVARGGLAIGTGGTSEAVFRGANWLQKLLTPAAKAVEPVVATAADDVAAAMAGKSGFQMPLRYQPAAPVAPPTPAPLAVEVLPPRLQGAPVDSASAELTRMLEAASKKTSPTTLREGAALRAEAETFAGKLRNLPSEKVSNFLRQIRAKRGADFADEVAKLAKVIE